MRAERICSLARFVISLAGQRGAHRRQPVARAHARRQRQPPPHAARGLPGHRRDPGPRHQRRGRARGARGGGPAACRGADAVHGHRALAHARRGPGGDRQELHEVIRKHSLAVAEAVSGGAPNDLLDRLGRDAAFAKVPAASLQAELEPHLYTGRSVQQVQEFTRRLPAAPARARATRSPPRPAPPRCAYDDRAAGSRRSPCRWCVAARCARCTTPDPRRCCSWRATGSAPSTS